MSVQLSVIKLLTFSNQPDIIAKFRSLAVKGALPPEVRSAVMESTTKSAATPAKMLPA